jgi:hypothetical protein
MILEKRIQAFVTLGNYLREAGESAPNKNEALQSYREEFDNLILYERNHNNFFTLENVKLAIKSIAEMLLEKNITDWLLPYRQKLMVEKPPVPIGVVMAGNIPMVGFHDLLTVLLSGNIFVGKMASGDARLLPHLAAVLIAIEPEFKDRINFVERITHVSAMIATGGNNSSRYFEYYFAKYPHIIRKNRNAVAVLTGQETKEDFVALGHDIFQYFGLGCRSVSKLFVPKGYDFIPLIEALHVFEGHADHTKYRNNYDYNKAILLINKVPHLDTGFLLFKEDEAMTSPISVVFYETYQDKNELEKRLKMLSEELQCVVSKKDFVTGAFEFGQAQFPALWDYADGVDTMEFLINQGFTS